MKSHRSFKKPCVVHGGPVIDDRHHGGNAMRGVMTNRSSYPQRESSGCDGFTLIEILVVIGIIALLVGLLLPALGQASGRTRSVVCASNMRQLAVGLAMYVEDDAYNRYPYVNFPTRPEQAGVLDPLESWVYTMKPYIDPHQIAVCPSDRSPYWTKPTPGMPGRFREVSFGLNYILAHVLYQDREEDPNYLYDNNIYGIDRPSSAVGAGEMSGQTLGYAVGDWVPAHSWMAWSPQFRYEWHFAVEHHTTALNWLFVDGHVKAVVWDEIFQPIPPLPPRPFFMTSTVDWAHNKLHPRVAR